MGGVTEVPHVNINVIKISKIMTAKVLDNKKWYHCIRAIILKTGS